MIQILMKGWQMGLSICYAETKVRAVISPVHFVEEEKTGGKDREGQREAGKKKGRKKLMPNRHDALKKKNNLRVSTGFSRLEGICSLEW